jgi:transcriptional regulator with XRE-family HTH domain
MAPQDITRALGKIIRQRRRAKTLSQEQLAFAADLNRNYISLIELGSSSPTVDSLAKIAAALDESASSLLAQAESLEQKAPVRRHKR